jgi:hypothetical protein
VVGEEKLHRAKEEKRKEKNMLATGGSLVTHDLENYITKEKRTCIN